MRAATYLSLSTLYDEIQAPIIQEMLQGFFHTFLEFPEYERLMAGSWGPGAQVVVDAVNAHGRIPRVLEFALVDDVKNGVLERDTRCALVGLFGEGWCTSEFAGLPPKVRENLLKSVGKRTTPANALAKLSSVVDAWSAEVREMILTGWKVVTTSSATRMRPASPAENGARSWRGTG
jgi:hypothetical protein